jgi:hypothetical protein
LPEREPESLAERQLANARRDPRLDHTRDAVVADWWAAVEAAERTRIVSILGVQALAGDTSREREKAMRERRELAEADIENEFAELNAMTLVSLLSALDALIESLAPRAREMIVAVAVSEAMEKAREQLPKEHSEVDPEHIEKVKAAGEQVILDRLGKISRATGAGAERWENVLRQTGLQAPEDRQIPEDLDETLCELVELRHVLVHRAGRIDERAIADAPSLAQEVGDLVRIGRDDYRRYTAAVRTYGNEVVYRLMRGVGYDPPDLSRWRENYLIGT